jgi:hypothetical protein
MFSLLVLVAIVSLFSGNGLSGLGSSGIFSRLLSIFRDQFAHDFGL